MSTHNLRISDSGHDQFVIDRLDLSKKLERADFYINRVQQRLKALEQKRLNLLNSEATEDVSERFEKLIKPNKTMSKEL